MTAPRLADPIRRSNRQAAPGARRRRQPGTYAEAWDATPSSKRYVARPTYESLEVVPHDLLMRANEKLLWIRRFVEEGCPRGQLRRLAEAVGAALGKTVPPYTTLVTWVHAYQQHGLLGLVDRTRADAGQSRVLRPEEVALLEVGLLGGKLGASQLLQMLVRYIPDTEATYDIVYRWLESYKVAHRGLVTLAGSGASVFRATHRLALTPPTYAAGEAYSVDSTVADVWVKIPDSKERAGYKAMRPVLTVVQDLGSRALLTFNLSLIPVSAEIVCATMRRAVDAEYNYPALPALGLPSIVVHDHGSEHRGMFERALGALGVQVMTGEPDAPESHGQVERLIGTISTECFGNLPGFSKLAEAFNPYETPEGDGKRTAGRRFSAPYRLEMPVESLLTLPQLETALLAWATTYNARPHPHLPVMTPVMRATLDAETASSAEAPR